MKTTYNLTDFPQLERVPKEQLDWLIENLEIEEIPKGGYLFETGSPIDNLLLIFEGDFELYFQQNNNRKPFGRIKKHEI